MRFSLNGVIATDDDAKIFQWFGLKAVSPAALRQALADNPAEEDFILEINSGGGSVYAGFEMFSLLRSAPVRTRAEVQSIAASAASVVLMGADVAAASPVAQVMIHLPTTTTAGNQAEHRKSIQVLESVTASILAAYESKCQGKTSRDELRRMMDKETFLTARQALDAGLLDEITGDAATPAPADILNAAFALPDLEKMRAAYREAHPAASKPAASTSPATNRQQARARMAALAQAQYTLTRDLLNLI